MAGWGVLVRGRGRGRGRGICVATGPRNAVWRGEGFCFDLSALGNVLATSETF